ncbi:MAG: enoyl-CoA hydratase-related protein [Chloroflexota bacterium]|nr:enoyl-CoA hydratase-related protein [Chloroflexota bacterium]
MTDYQYLKFSVEDRVGTLTIDHPPVNALNRSTLDELGAVLGEIEGGSDVRALILTGAGQAFVAGADIKEMTQVRGPEQAQALLQGGLAVLNRLDNLPIPTIAAVNGYCLGGGNELALACDFRLAGDRARFGQPEINLGLIPGFGGTVRLTRLVGPARALEIMLTGADISAQDALRMGLVSRVVPDGTVVREARKLADLLARQPAGAVKAILAQVNEGYGLPVADALALESGRFAALIGSPDAREGLTAFVEKRKPTFQ